MDIEAFLREARALARDATRTAKALRLPRGQFVYNVHTYAWPCYEAFVRRYHTECEHPVAFLAMNPGKYGAVQSGIPFTDYARARDLLPEFERLRRQPRVRLPKPGQEQSGRRVYAWGVRRFGSVEAFFRECVFLITCPLAVLAWRGNRAVNVPLSAFRRQNRERIVAMIDRHLPRLLAAVEPRGALLLGTWARDTWGGFGIPAEATLHPAAHLPDEEWIVATDRAFRRLAARIGGPA